MNIEEREAIAERAARGGVAYEDLVERPTVVEPRPRALYVFDRRPSRPTLALRAWGVSLLVASVVGWLVFTNARPIEGVSSWIVAALVLGVAAVLIVRGRPGRRDADVPLAWIDSSSGVLRVREYPGQTALTDSSSVAFDEVDEILFAVRGVPVPHGRSDARVEGAGVFVRLLDGAVWPVIPATHARQEAYSIAAGLAARIGVGVKQVGAGWSSRDVD